MTFEPPDVPEAPEPDEPDEYPDGPTDPDLPDLPDLPDESVATDAPGQGGQSPGAPVPDAPAGWSPSGDQPNPIIAPWPAVAGAAIGAPAHPAAAAWPPLGARPGDPGLAGWKDWVPEQRPAMPFPVGAPPDQPPGAISIVARGIDLNAGMSGEIRRASLYAGLMFLLTVGPIAALLIAVIVRAGSLEGVIDAIRFSRPGSVPRVFGFGQFGGLVVALGGLCFAIVSIDLQMVAIALIGGRAAGRRVDLRTALGIARRSFWRLILGALTVGLILIVPRLALSMSLQHSSSEVSFLVSTVVDILLAAPFAYLGAAVVLGGATAIVAVRASWRTARRRWRLALVVGIVNAAVSIIALFALGAGLDVVSRIAAALGVGSGTGVVQAAQLGVVLTILLIAGGSLTMTIATLTTAPQIVAWLGLGGTTTGLPDPAAIMPAGHRRPRLIGLPMQVALVAEFTLAAISLVGRA